jgi:hypothetical protein
MMPTALVIVLEIFCITAVNVDLVVAVFTQQEIVIL